MATFESIYAVASMTPIDRDSVRAALTQPALLPASVNGVRVDLLTVERSVRAGCRITAKVRVSNRSACRLASLGPFPVHCAYHWTSGERVVVFDGRRTALWPPLVSGDTQVVEMEVDTPSEPGRYELVVTLVQEEQFWFDAAIPGCVATASIEVR